MGSSWTDPLRFVVSLTRGFRTAHVGGSQKPGLSALVLDRLACYRLIREYQSETVAHGTPVDASLGEVLAIGTAVDHAERLNREPGGL